MKSFVVMTYYQLMHATAMTLYLNEKSNLYFISNYLHVDDDLIDRIRKTGIFNRVIKVDQEEGMEPYDLAMKKTEEMDSEEIDRIGNSIFEKYLEPFYEKIFADADFEDEIYVYNDLQRPYYYISKHFKKIVGVEDGYGSIAQQLEIHRFKGKYALVNPFVGKYYPEPLYKHENVIKIISSCEFDNLPEYYSRKIEVLDFNYLVELNKKDFVRAQEYIFNIESINIENGGVLILTTPLSRAKYCTAYENFLLFKKMVNEEKRCGKHIYIKPHPADIFVDYSLLEDEQVTLIPKEFPIELLEYRGTKFSRAVSFGSTAIVDKICDESRTLYSGKVTQEKVSKAIKEYIGDEKLNLNIYIKLTGMSPDRYINAFSFNRRLKKFNTRIIFVVENGKKKEYEDYFDKRNLKKRIKEFVRTKSTNEYRRFLYEKQLKDQLKEGNSITIAECDKMDDICIYDRIIKNDEFDYFMLIDDFNNGITIMRQISKLYQKWIKFCVAFFNYTYRENDLQTKVFLGTGKIGDAYTDQIGNRLWHRSLMKYIDDNTVSRVLHYNSDRVIFVSRVLLHKDYKEFSKIEDGKNYYINKLEKISIDKYPKEVIECDIAIAVREYYDWALVMCPNRISGITKEFLRDSGFDSDILQRIEAEIIEQLLAERKSEFNRVIYKKMDNYNRYGRYIDEYINKGVFDRILLQNLIINKIKKVKKRIKRKINRMINRQGGKNV